MLIPIVGSVISCKDEITLSPENAQWHIQDSNTNYNLNSVLFIDSFYGWVAGDNGVILHTTNGGINWISQISNSSKSLKSISFCDKINGWAVGDENTVLATSNGGITWRNIEFDTSNNIFNIRVQCISPTMAIILNKRWEFDVMVDPCVWMTTDAGNTWTEIAPQPFYFSWYFDFHFVNESLGFISGISGNAYEKLITIRVQNYGLYLDTSYINRNVQGGFRKIFFKNNDEGWLSADSIYYTTNSGLDWQGLTENEFSEAKDLIMFVDIGFIIDANGRIFKTIDGGYSWLSQLSG